MRSFAHPPSAAPIFTACATPASDATTGSTTPDTFATALVNSCAAYLTQSGALSATTTFHSERPASKSEGTGSANPPNAAETTASASTFSEIDNLIRFLMCYLTINRNPACGTS